jgi:type I site-specific restriction endonuclease
MYKTLNLPQYEIKIKQQGHGHYIFDCIRKKYIKLTPEEWVRQHVLNYLINHLKYPQGLTAVEYTITVNQLNKRCDIVAFNQQGIPLLIVECKAPEVSITQTTFDQIATYNLKLNVGYLVVTNGLQHYCCKMEYNPLSYSFLEKIPAYSAII